MTFEDLVTALFGAASREETEAALASAGITAASLAGRPKYPVPGPYEVALSVGAALAASGSYATPGAAMAAAWMAVPEFYQGRDAYLRDLAPIVLGMGSTEGEANGAAAEAH